jgi:hypothetical protein
MKYYLFLDECGDHSLKKPFQSFPIFLLCGVLTSIENYQIIRKAINDLKLEIWGNKNVIFHSRDIRKCEKEFRILVDLVLKNEFYEKINQIVSMPVYSIIASAIKQAEYINKFGLLQDNVYKVALSFVIEQSVIVLGQIEANAELAIIIERRGIKEDKQLFNHFNQLCTNGLSTLTAQKLKKLSPSLIFHNKKENINGLQLADLVAYPIARYVLEPDKPNRAFKILEPRIYKGNATLVGLKIYP